MEIRALLDRLILTATETVLLDVQYRCATNHAMATSNNISRVLPHVCNDWCDTWHDH